MINIFHQIDVDVVLYFEKKIKIKKAYKYYRGLATKGGHHLMKTNPNLHLILLNDTLKKNPRRPPVRHKVFRERKPSRHTLSLPQKNPKQN